MKRREESEPAGITVVTGINQEEPIVVSDETWTATQDGPIGENDFMGRYDAGKNFRWNMV